jgi:hypothetical protein
MASNTHPISRKRPAPTQPPPTSSSNNSVTSLRIDTLLAKYAQNLPPGGTISIQLIKGGSTSSVDPIAVRKAAVKKERQLQRAAAAAAAAASAASGMSSGMSSGNDSDGGGGGSSSLLPAAAAAAALSAAEKLTLTFPRIAKFPETVSKPNFYSGGLRDGRMYEEEVPLAKVSVIGDCYFVVVDVCCVVVWTFGVHTQRERVRER